MTKTSLPPGTRVTTPAPTPPSAFVTTFQGRKLDQKSGGAHSFSPPPLFPPLPPLPCPSLRSSSPLSSPPLPSNPFSSTLLLQPAWGSAVRSPSGIRGRAPTTQPSQTYFAAILSPENVSSGSDLFCFVAYEMYDGGIKLNKLRFWIINYMPTCVLSF